MDIEAKLTGSETKPMDAEANCRQQESQSGYGNAEAVLFAAADPNHTENNPCYRAYGSWWEQLEGSTRGKKRRGGGKL